MGYHSELMISMNESHQFTDLDKTICCDCVVDDALKKVVSDSLVASKCSYCGEESENGELIAAPYNVVMERVYDSIFLYYADAQDTDMPWVDGGWLFEQSMIEEVMYEFDPGWPVELNEDLTNSCDPNLYLVEHVNNDWAIDSPERALSHGWSAFKKQVLTKTRYLFLSEPEDEYSFGRPDYISISSMLAALGKLCNSESLVTVIPAGTLFYRVRVNNDGSEFGVFADMGAPPVGETSAGRMNPAGIPYFYVANDQETAEKEVLNSEPRWSTATFMTKVDIPVIDFVGLPAIPSKFEPEKYGSRQNIMFLHSFLSDLTAPVEKNDREHIEYVPTQIVSEYFRYRFKTNDGKNVLGLRYPSVKNKNGTNVTIFESDNEALSKIFDLVSIAISS